MSAADLREAIEDALGELCGNADIRFGNESDRIAENALASLAALVGLLQQAEQRAEVEPREGMVTVYDSSGKYVGCMGEQVWADFLEVSAAADTCSGEEQKQGDWFDGVLDRATAGEDRYTRLPTTDWEGVVWGWRKGEELLREAVARAERAEQERDEARKWANTMEHERDWERDVVHCELLLRATDAEARVRLLQQAEQRAAKWEATALAAEEANLASKVELAKAEAVLAIGGEALYERWQDAVARAERAEQERDEAKEALQWLRDSRAEAAEARVGVLEEALRDIRALVDEQAEEEGLWAVYPMGTQPISEAYLQQELRRLHALIEAKTSALDAAAPPEEKA